MKRIQKGTPGYLNYKKKVEILRTVLYFGIVIAIFLLGYFQTGTRLNLLTVVAILGCLPSAKALVGVITRFPHRSIDIRTAEEIREKTSHLTVCYDLIITSEEKIMPVDCIAISGHNLYGYTHSGKVDVKYLGEHIQKMLSANQLTGIKVIILNEYRPFLSRVEGLDHIAEIEKEDTKEKEEAVRNLILNISM